MGCCNTKIKNSENPKENCSIYEADEVYTPLSLALNLIKRLKPHLKSHPPAPVFKGSLFNEITSQLKSMGGSK